MHCLWGYTAKLNLNESDRNHTRVRILTLLNWLNTFSLWSFSEAVYVQCLFCMTIRHFLITLNLHCLPDCQWVVSCKINNNNYNNEEKKGSCHIRLIWSGAFVAVLLNCEIPDNLVVYRFPCTLIPPKKRNLIESEATSKWNIRWLISDFVLLWLGE